MCYSLWYNAPTMLRVSRPATSWVHYTTSCNTQSSAPGDGQNNCPKHVELIGIINKLLLYLVGCLYYLYQLPSSTTALDTAIQSNTPPTRCHEKQHVSHRSPTREDSEIMSDKLNVTNFMQLRPSCEANSSRLPQFIQPAAGSSPCSQQPTTSHPLHTISSYFRITQCYTHTLLPSTPRSFSQHQRFHAYSQNKLLTMITYNHHTMTLYRQWTYISKHSLSCRLHTPCNLRPGKQLTVHSEHEIVSLKQLTVHTEHETVSLKQLTVHTEHETVSLKQLTVHTEHEIVGLKAGLHVVVK